MDMPHERIQSRADLRRFQRADARVYGYEHWSLLAFAHDPVWRWQRAYRRVEWARFCWPTVLRPAVGMWRWVLRSRAIRLGFTIAPGVAGPGLCLAHWGTIGISEKARLGADCRINFDTSIGVKDGAAATLGDGCVLMPGARLVGGVVLGDRCVVGANAVVTRSFPADSVLVGVPARLIEYCDTAEQQPLPVVA